MGIFETFFSRLQAELVKKDENDMVFWMDLKNTVFYVTYLYFVLELGISISFPTGIISNSWVHSKQVFYLLFFFFAWEANCEKYGCWINFRGKGGQWWIVVFFVETRRSQLITISFIVPNQRFSTGCYSPCLV